MKHIFICVKCGKYTMKEKCSCGNETLMPRPLKYTPDDRLSAYRRKAKHEEYLKRGLI
ncbi:ribosome biogenesis protein [Candidatus Woesearchaeota archaeon]|nr:ribosome biogenesis protein [Candidatus Woesearchaeota archaeon]